MLIETFPDEHTPSPAPPPASSVVNQETAEPAPKRKKPSRMEEKRAERVAAAVAGSTGIGGAQSLPSVTGRRVMISRELLVYLAEPDQIDVDGFNLLGFWSRRGTDSTHMPDDRHGHASSGNAVSSFLSSVVSWSRGH